MLKYQKIIGIMACDSNNLIGNAGSLPWHYPTELDFFRTTTYAQIIIMGANTFHTMPQSILKDRFNIIFSKTIKAKQRQENVIYVSSINDFLSLDQLPQSKKYFMIGGAELATLFLINNMISTFLLTRIKSTYIGDRFFPFELLKHWPSIIVRADREFTIYQYFHYNSCAHI
jgi:dihydrofolate reductase